jgi:putative sugar O-methyltransferase
MDQILEEAREAYKRISVEYDRANYYATHPLNEFWGSINLRTMRELILGAKTAIDVIHGAQKTMMFSVNEDNRPITQRAVEWLLEERQERIARAPWLAELHEAECSYPPNNVSNGDKRLNPDFLRCVNIAAQIHHFIGERLDVVELGGGLGHLARVLRLGTISRSHVIIDIPETLVFSYCFLRTNFPDAKCVWLEPGQELPAEYDFAFVPAMLCEQVAWKPFDLFLNTASMGEMTNTVIRQWMDFIQNRLNVKNLFTLNRFLNTIHQGLRWRLAENECSVHYDERWTILNWELEPEYTRCPYIDSRVSRYVEIIAMRNPERKDIADAWCAETLAAVEAEDWARLWDDGHVMGMRDGPICADGGMNGTLFKLWELMRLQPSARAAGLMVRWLMKLSRAGGVIFEELPYYQAKAQEQQCERVGNFARCELPKGHDGAVHKNRQEEFIQQDVA